MSDPIPYDQRHARRFELSMLELLRHLPPSALVLEMGGRGPFTPRMQAQGWTVFSTDTDLRYALPACDCTEMYDAVVCMEVLEHIHDREPEGGEIPTEWFGDGTATLLAEAFRVLKPGGILFLTTPNASSLNVLHKVLTHQPPMVYRPHVREYGPHELAALVMARGFRDLTVTSCDPWGDSMSADERARIAAAVAALGYRTDCRGEDLFLTAFKPAAQ